MAEHYDRVRTELGRWSDADIGRAAAPALVDLGIMDPVVWYGGLKCNTSEFGAWVRPFLLDSIPGSPEPTLHHRIAARFLLLAENYGITTNLAIAATLLCRLAVIEAFFARADAYAKLAEKVEPDVRA